MGFLRNLRSKLVYASLGTQASDLGTLLEPWGRGAVLSDVAGDHLEEQPVAAYLGVCWGLHLRFSVTSTP